MCSRYYRLQPTGADQGSKCYQTPRWRHPGGRWVRTSSDRMTDDTNCDPAHHFSPGGVAQMHPLRRNSGVDHEHSEDFAAFYAAAWGGCLRAVRAVVGDPVQAEELTAEAFAKAFARWREVQRHPAPRAWGVRVAVNTHISWWRKRRREVPWGATGSANDRAAEDVAPLLDGRVEAAVLALPRRQREVIA